MSQVRHVSAVPMHPSEHVRATVDVARRLAVLATVPFLVALMRWRNLVATGADTSTRFSVTFPTPHSFVSLWSFVNAPTEPGAGAATGDLPLVVGTAVGALFVVSLAVYVLLSGLALAGYLGSIAEGATGGSFDFLANVRRYGRPLVAYEAASLLALLGFVGVLAAVPALLPAVAAVLFAVAYLTYLAPYLVVVEDVGLVAAVRRSVQLTTGRVEAAAAFVAFVVAGAVVSVPLSALAYGNGVGGGVLAAALAAPLGLLASVGFVLFARDLTGGADAASVPGR
jgi:hypothetical protein